MKNPWTKVLRFLVLAALGTSVSSAATATFRYYRFRTTKVRGNTLLVQLAEFKFFNGGVAVTGGTATDPSPGSYPANENPTLAIDGLTTNKWLDFNFNLGRLIVDFGTPKTIDSYNYYTGNDASERDPVSWVLEGSNDDPALENWTAVDVVTNFVPTNSRNTIATATNFALPTAVKASIEFFQYSDTAQSMIVKNGSGVELYFDTAQATSSTLSSNGTETFPASFNADQGTFYTVHPNNSKLTTYTLTANSLGGNATATIPLRTVAGGTLDYRYVRYTPVKVAKNLSISMNDFQFKLNGTTVPVASVENPGGTVVVGKEVSKLIDDPLAVTTFTSGNLSPIIFDLGTSPVQYDSYSFLTGSDVNAIPLRWIMEGSADKTSWTLISNVYFDFNTPSSTNAGNTTDIPFEGTSVAPYAKISTDVSVAAAGESTTLSWSVLGATSATISPGIGVVASSGTMTVSPSTTTTYTISTTSASGVSSEASTKLTVVPSIPSTFTYANFNEHAAIKPVGFTAFLNDFANFTAAGNVTRLRLTETSGSQHSAAWYETPVKVSDGFDTTFDAFVANKVTSLGADGMAFVIQNTPAGSAAINDGVLYLPNNAVTVALDSYPDQTFELSKYATLQVFQGSTLLKLVDITSTGPAGAGQSLAHGLNHNYLADYNNAAANPYHMRVVYAAGKISVYIDSVLVIDSLTVDLSSAMDAKGRAYVGFTARTGGLSETHDVTAWSFTSSGTVAPTNPLVLTGYTINTTAHTAALTWSSNTGKSYKITQSSDLVTWVQVPGSSNVTASSASTSSTVNYTTGTSGFFRVEEVTTP